jgi:hypothetical protein
LLFGAVAGSLREQFGPDGENIFTRIRDSEKFRDTSRELFNGLKRWFFEEAVPRHKLERGDIFMISTELLVDPDTGEVIWNKDKTELHILGQKRQMRTDGAGLRGLKEGERGDV